MRRISKALSVLLVLALVMMAVLRPDLSVSAEESGKSQAVQEESTEKTTEDADQDDSSEKEGTDEDDSSEGEGTDQDASSDEEGKDAEEGDSSDDEKTEEGQENSSDSEEKEEESKDSPDGEEGNEAEDPSEGDDGDEKPDVEDPEGSVTPEGDQQEPQTPENGEAEDPGQTDPDQEGEEKDPEDSENPEDSDKENPEEEDKKEEEEKPSLQIIDGIHLVAEKLADYDIEALPLSALLTSLQDGDGNALSIPETAATIWIRVKDSQGSVVYGDQYDVNSEAVLDLVEYILIPGYTMELTAGAGEAEAPGNVRYIVNLYIETPNKDNTSLLPLEEVYANLTIEGFQKDPRMTVKDILTNLKDYSGKPVSVELEGKVAAWKCGEDSEGNYMKDAYRVLGLDEEIPLSEYVNGGYLELIVGSGGQLDPNNIRYLIRVEEIGYEVIGSMWTTDADGMKQVGDTRNLKDYLSYRTESTYGVEYRLEQGQSLSGEYSYVLEFTGLEDSLLGVVDGSFSTWEDAKNALDNGGNILFQLSRESGGYKADYTTGVILTLVFKDEFKMGLYVQLLYDKPILYGRLYQYNTDKGSMEEVSYSHRIDTADSGYPMSYTLNIGYAEEEQYRFALELDSSSTSGLDLIEAAAAGNFETREEVISNDIKDKLFKPLDGSQPYGYEGNYSGDGISFTLSFTDSTLYHFTVKARTNTSEPDTDPWLIIKGLEQVMEDGTTEPLTTYVVENDYKHDLDSEYNYGYRTIFVEEPEVDLSRLHLLFSVPVAERATLYFAEDVEGSGEPITEDTVIDFSGEKPKEFGLVVKEGEKRNRRNYWIKVVKKSEESPLFVAPSPEDEDGNSYREVFLDQNHEYKHDILIANIGSEPLTGLTATLDAGAAAHCQIDSYWNVNGDTLPPFGDIEKDYLYPYGEQRMAKVTLIPKDNDNGGEINGTLTISAEGQEPIVIQLKGFAGDPRILTENLPEKPAVTWVPYSCLIMTNCQYDWIEQEFKREGELPDGIEVDKATGEIYGVPTVRGQTGDFTFTVTASFKEKGEGGYVFQSDTKEYTLTVIDNTDENAYNASDADAGYQLNEPIGEDMGGYHYVVREYKDELFESNGDLGTFRKVFLNGRKLGADEYYITRGSTKITVRKQTLENKASRTDRNTLAAEFRDGNTMHRTAQNFYLEIQENPPVGPTDTPPTVDPQPSVPTVPATPPVSTTTPVPQPTVSPQPTTNPQPTTEPEPTTEPQPTTNPEPTTGPQPTTNPEPTTGPQPTTNPQPTTGPQPSGSPQPTTEPQPSGSPQPTSGPQPSGTPGTSGAPQPSGSPNVSGTPQPTEAPYVSGTPQPTVTPQEINYVNVAVRLVDGDGNPLVTRTLEMHSDPVTSTTDVNGLAGFGRVEFGTHTISMKDEYGNLGATNSYTIQPGDALSMEANVITAQRGSSITINMTYDEGILILNSVQEGIQSKIAPQTGDESAPGTWAFLMFVSLGAVILSCRRRMTR